MTSNKNFFGEGGRSAFWHSPEPQRGTPFERWLAQQEGRALNSADDRGPTPTPPDDEFFHTLQGAHPDHWIFQDSVTTKRLRDVLRDSQAAKETTSEEDSRLTQTRGPGQTFGADKPVPTGLASQSSNDPHEFLKGKKGAEAWNKTKKM
jgi:hypothetical protein